MLAFSRRSDSSGGGKVPRQTTQSPCFSKFAAPVFLAKSFFLCLRGWSHFPRLNPNRSWPRYPFFLRRFFDLQKAPSIAHVVLCHCFPPERVPHDLLRETPLKLPPPPFFYYLLVRQGLFMPKWFVYVLLPQPLLSFFPRRMVVSFSRPFRKSPSKSRVKFPLPRSLP